MFMIIDIRDSADRRAWRILGPYTAATAEKVAAQQNDYVEPNIRKGPKRPFEVRPYVEPPERRLTAICYTGGRA